MTREPVRPDPEYVVTSHAHVLVTALGSGTAQLCRGEVLPSGITVYRPESTGRLVDLCRQAERLNAAALADALKRLAEQGSAELADAVADEREGARWAAQDGPHSRACGIRNHEHGHECSDNCPTCHGKVGLQDAGHELTKQEAAELADCDCHDFGPPREAQ